MSTNNVTTINFTKNDRVTAGIIMITVGVVGLVTHMIAFYFFLSLKDFRNTYGYLCLSNSACAIIITSMFIFFTSPVAMMLYELPSEFIINKIGQFLLILYYVTMYTHVGTAINRFFAICMPLAYRRLNTPKITKISICLVWTAGFLHFIPLNFNCNFYFDNNDLQWIFSTSDFCNNYSLYIDYIYSCSLMGCVFLLDCITLFSLRKRYRLQESKKSSLTERRELKKEMIFFVQAFINMGIFIAMLFSFHVLYYMTSDSEWGGFYTATFSWEFMHAFDGIVLAIFSSSWWYYKRTRNTVADKKLGTPPKINSLIIKGPVQSVTTI